MTTIKELVKAAGYTGDQAACLERKLEAADIKGTNLDQIVVRLRGQPCGVNASALASSLREAAESAAAKPTPAAKSAPAASKATSEVNNGNS